MTTSLRSAVVQLAGERCGALEELGEKTATRVREEVAAWLPA
jgi:hypothetical protein